MYQRGGELGSMQAWRNLASKSSYLHTYLPTCLRLDPFIMMYVCVYVGMYMLGHGVEKNEMMARHILKTIAR